MTALGPAPRSRHAETHSRACDLRARQTLELGFSMQGLRHALTFHWGSQARSEIYVGKLRQRLCFVPGVLWLQLGSWCLPEAPLQALATAVRRTARLLWTLHLTFQEGFDEVCRLRPFAAHQSSLLLTSVHAVSNEVNECMCKGERSHQVNPTIKRF